MKIPYSRQWIDNQDLREVEKVLKSDFITQGPKIDEFETEISRYVNSSYCIAVNSATSALHLACLALGLKKGDLFWTSPISFVASANCGIYCGAEVDFVDIHEDTFNIDVYSLEKKLHKAKTIGRLPKVIIPVHMAGQSSDAKKIYELVKPYNIKIIEDASHSIGGTYNNKKIGSCKFSDVTVFSFHPVKIITSGEGGAIVTNNKNIFNKVRLLRSHGINKNPKLFNNKNYEDWHYEQIELGFNYRITDIQASLGISQLKKIDVFIEKRNELAQKYYSMLKDQPLYLPVILDNVKSSFHLYIIRVKDKKKHKTLFDYLRQNGILVNLHYIPIHLHPYYKKLGFKKGMFPKSEKYYSQAMSIPIFPQLKNFEQEFICEKIQEVISK